MVVVAHTDSEVGEAAVRGALDAVDLLGPGAGQLPPHRSPPSRPLVVSIGGNYPPRPLIYLDNTTGHLEVSPVCRPAHCKHKMPDLNHSHAGRLCGDGAPNVEAAAQTVLHETGGAVGLLGIGQLPTNRSGCVLVIADCTV